MKTEPHPDARLTVREVWDRHYDQSEIAQSMKNKVHYELNRWERLTGNPPISEITVEVLAEYRAAALAEGLAPSTVNSTWITIRAVLRLMAPPFQGNPRGKGVITQVPYFKPCKSALPQPRRVKLDDLSRLYLACESARFPRSSFPTRDWWRALLVVAYFTGLRKSDLFAIERKAIDLDAGEIHFQAQKTGKSRVMTLHPLALQHVARIWFPDRQYLFPGMRSKGGRFHGYLHSLLDEAGIERFGLHDIRRTGASEVERVRPGMAKVFLQHAAESVTDRFYLNLDEEMSEAVNAMRIPEAFHDLSSPEADALKAALENRKVQPRDMRVKSKMRSVDPAEWKFKPGGFMFRGQWFDMKGKELQLLEELVVESSPLETNVLVDRLYPNRNGSASRDCTIKIRLIASGLRRTLRRIFNLPDTFNPVPCVNLPSAAYTIYLPCEKSIGGEA